MNIKKVNMKKINEIKEARQVYRFFWWKGRRFFKWNWNLQIRFELNKLLSEVDK